MDKGLDKLTHTLMNMSMAKGKDVFNCLDTDAIEQISKLCHTDENIAKVSSLLMMKNQVQNVTTLLPPQLNEYYWEQICKSIPGDMIVFKSYEESESLFHMFFPEDYSAKGTPIDLLQEETLPLPDLRMSTTFMLENTKEEVTTDIRVVIFPDYKEKIDNSMEKQIIPIIGAYIMYPTFTKKKVKNFFFGLLSVLPGTDFIYDSGLIGSSGNGEFLCPNMNLRDLHQMNFKFMMDWYCIQLTLLNPPTKVIYEKLREQTTTSIKTTYNTKRKKNKVCYIKKIHLNPEKNFGEKDSEKYKKSCPFWRVIGHWRTYKNGKNVFIKSYWKGKSRNFVPKSFGEDEIRERVLVVQKEDE